MDPRALRVLERGAMTTTTPTSVALARSAIEAMASGAAEDFARIIAPDAHNREAATEPLACREPGPAGWYATALWLRDMFSDMRWEIHEAVADGDLVALHVTMRGVHTGRYTKYAPDGTVVVDRPPSGRAFAATQSHWFRVADGQLVEHWANRDDLAVATQLGLLG
jgi:predicted ester cyclase